MRNSGAILLLSILPLLMVILCGDTITAEDAQPFTIAGVSREEALRLGERMYREGILPSGEPLQAVVEGDIPVDGRMFSCMSCHQRSGLGSLEGNVITFPIDGVRLYRPLSKMGELSPSSREKVPKWMWTGDFRPAYNDKTLAASLRAGEDPSGRKLNDVMPRYFLDDRDMEIMIFYLKNLSAEISPGVTDTTLRLATVVTEEVNSQDREAMLAPLRLYTSTWGKSRSLEARAKRAGFTEEVMNRGFRNLTLSVWELKGPSEGWREQLEAHYRKEPVFALVGGITTGDWAPIHRFSEEHKIPCILPITDFPVISETDWYTLYFSKGLYQEGEAVAKYLHGPADISQDVTIVQVFRNTRTGRALSKGFQETWENFGRSSPEGVMLDQKETVSEDFWKKLTKRHRRSVVLLWLDSQDLSAIGGLEGIQDRPRMVFVSSSLLGKSLYTLPEGVRGFVYITYPYVLPEQDKGVKAGVEAWLRINKIPVTNLNIGSRMYFLVSIVSNPLSMMKGYFYRDRFLELIDMMADQPYPVAAVYPRLSFGPGQRYASKGCYIVQLTEGPGPELVKRSDWVFH